MPERDEPTEDAAPSSDGLSRLANEAAEFADRTYDRVARELRNARALGQMAVTFGTNEVNRRVRPKPAAQPERTPPSATTSTTDAASTVEHGAIDDLIAGYDDLSASQVVGLLEDLDSAGLERVADHERRGRGRKTILNRAAQLLESPS